MPLADTGRVFQRCSSLAHTYIHACCARHSTLCRASISNAHTLCAVTHLYESRRASTLSLCAPCLFRIRVSRHATCRLPPPRSPTLSYAAHLSILATRCYCRVSLALLLFSLSLSLSLCARPMRVSVSACFAVVPTSALRAHERAPSPRRSRLARTSALRGAVSVGRWMSRGGAMTLDAMTLLPLRAHELAPFPAPTCCACRPVPRTRQKPFCVSSNFNAIQPALFDFSLPTRLTTRNFPFF